jgi:hypothetical protein
MAEKAKRALNANFSDEENIHLLSEIEARYSIITQRVKTASVCRQKRVVWKQIADAVNSVGGQGRNEDNVKKRWKDMKDDVKNGKRRATMTGGGPPDGPAPYEEEVLAILGDSSTVGGVGKLQYKFTLFYNCLDNLKFALFLIRFSPHSFKGA